MNPCTDVGNNSWNYWNSIYMFYSIRLSIKISIRKSRGERQLRFKQMIFGLRINHFSLTVTVTGVAPSEHR